MGLYLGAASAGGDCADADQKTFVVTPIRAQWSRDAGGNATRISPAIWWQGLVGARGNVVIDECGICMERIRVLLGHVGLYLGAAIDDGLFKTVELIYMSFGF